MRRAVLQEVHPSTSQSQVVEPPAGEAMKVYFSCLEDGKFTSLMENYKNTWMQESAFFAWREKPLMPQLRKMG